MATLQELRKQRDMLKSRKQSREEINIIGKQRAELQKEIFELKHPKRTAFKKALISGGRKLGSAAVKKLQAPPQKKGGKYAPNFDIRDFL